MGALADYLDLHNSTRYIPYPDRGKFMSLIGKRNYMLDFFMKSNDRTRFSGGLGIEFRDLVNIGGGGKGTAITTMPGIPNALNKIEKTAKRKESWCYVIDNDTITEQELAYTEGAPKEHQLLNMMAINEERMATSIIAKWERTLAAVPSYAEMESDGGKEPKSIFAYITEAVGGIHPAWGGSTVGGYDPAVIKQWDNIRGAYGHTTGAGAGTLLSAALSKAIRYAKFPRLPLEFGAEHQATPAVTAIGCSDWGYRQYEDGIVRQSSDPFRTQATQDQIPGGVRAKGRHFLVWDEFEEAPVYAAAGGTYETEENATLQGPRYYGLNSDLLHPMVHTDHYFKKMPIRTDATLPYDHVMYRDLWTNLICKDRRGLFVVSPSVNQPMI